VELRITESQNVRGWKGPLWVQLPCWSRVTNSWLHRTLSRQVLNISREEESKISLGNLLNSQNPLSSNLWNL